MQNHSISIVYVFSYWIFVWFVIYYLASVLLGIRGIPNPKLALYLAAAENIALFAYFIMRDAPTRNLFVFAFINTWIKLVPIYLLRNVKMHESDIVWVFLLYVAYLLMGFFFYGGIGFVNKQADLLNAYMAKDNANLPKTYWQYKVEEVLDSLGWKA